MVIIVFFVESITPTSLLPLVLRPAAVARHTVGTPQHHGVSSVIKIVAAGFTFSTAFFTTFDATGDVETIVSDRSSASWQLLKHLLP